MNKSRCYQQHWLSKGIAKVDQKQVNATLAFALVSSTSTGVQSLKKISVKLKKIMAGNAFHENGH